jgi:uncharacterized protein YwbE
MNKYQEKWSLSPGKKAEVKEGMTVSRIVKQDEKESK